MSALQKGGLWFWGFLSLLSAQTTWAQAGRENQDTAALGVSIGSGARALGMGGAFIAVADDATAASWNPAGIAVLEKPEASIVWKARDRQTLDFSPRAFTTENSSASFFGTSTSTFTEKTGGQVDSLAASGLDFLSLSYPFRIGRFKVVPQVNYQRAIEGGYDAKGLRDLVITAHGDDRFESDDGTVDTSFFDATETDSVQRQSAGGIDIWTVSIAASASSKLSVGSAFNWWRNGTIGQVVDSLDYLDCTGSPDTFGQSCSHQISPGRFSSQETFRGFNINLGLLWRPMRKLRIGLVYKLPFTMKLTGSASGTSNGQVTTIEPNGRRKEYAFAYATTSQSEGQIRWPRTMGVGVAVMPRETLTLSADFTTTRWSKAEYEYSSREESASSDENPDFPFHSSSSAFATQAHLLWPTLLPLDGFPRKATSAEQFRRQRDTYQGRLGVEYIVTARKLVVPLRAGGFVDRQYYTDRRGGDVRNWGWTLGAGLVWSRFSFDLAYLRQAVSYNLDVRLETPTESQKHLVQTSLQDDRFSTTKIYLSTIVRF